jgi:hypothetical protein
MGYFYRRIASPGSTSKSWGKLNTSFASTVRRCWAWQRLLCPKDLTMNGAYAEPASLDAGE